MLRTSVTLILGFLTLLGHTYRLAQAGGEPAVTSAAEAGPLFPLVGEYLGNWKGSPVGLQVTTQEGEMPFLARLYPGGLPGIGGNPEEAVVFEGKAPLDESLEGQQLPDEVLVKLEQTDGGLSIELTPGVATISELGGSLGRLEKVNRRGVTLGLAPPPTAKILFDGTSTDAFKDARMTEDGYLAGGAETIDPMGACHLHLEFRTPFMARSKSQNRGNSGVYLQRRYEVQILDSFALEPVFNGCAALYRQRQPDVNMSLPPLAWQTYDIFFTPAQFDAEGNKTGMAEISVIHNGVPVHYRNIIKTKTGAGRPEGPDPLPLLLQDHGDPVVFRNVWLQPAAAGTRPTRSTAGLEDSRLPQEFQFTRHLAPPEPLRLQR